MCKESLRREKFQIARHQCYVEGLRRMNIETKSQDLAIRRLAVTFKNNFSTFCVFGCNFAKENTSEEKVENNCVVYSFKKFDKKKKKKFDCKKEEAQ